MARSRLLLHHPARLVGVAVVTAVVLMVTVALYLASRPARTLDRATPEGTVQAYVTAVLDGDHATAVTYFAPGGRCDATDLDRIATPQSVRVDLVDSRISGETAQVRVTVTYDPGGGPFGGSWSEDHVFRLVRTSSGWLLSGIPWPLYDCEGGVR
jgi:hypothetical protein